MHKPVLLHEVLQYLEVKPSGIYVDSTFGRAGHSLEILSRLGPNGRLLVIDKDLAAIKAAKKIALNDKRLIVRHGSFSKIQEWIVELGFAERVNGILMDLGVSSPQLDEASRGFSFLRDGLLDMRMDQKQELTAAKWVNTVSEKEMVRVFKEYGEERFSGRIARAIVKEREQEPIMNTARLAAIVRKANPSWEKYKHPATRVFQAIRIVINDELHELTLGLENCLDVLTIGGRLLVISFHSLEDRIIKGFIRKHMRGHELPEGVPLRQEQLKIRLRCIGRAIKPSSAEIENNPRARSAKLRVMEKLL